MSRVCKPGGKILLLEHGRSHYNWLSRILDQNAVKHAKKWGCWWNRDILSILRAAGLEIETHKSFHFGTTHYVIITNHSNGNLQESIENRVLNSD